MPAPLTHIVEVSKQNQPCKRLLISANCNVWGKNGTLFNKVKMYKKVKDQREKVLTLGPRIRTAMFSDGSGSKPKYKDTFNG